MKVEIEIVIEKLGKAFPKQKPYLEWCVATMELSIGIFSGGCQCSISPENNRSEKECSVPIYAVRGRSSDSDSIYIIAWMTSDGNMVEIKVEANAKDNIYYVVGIKLGTDASTYFYDTIRSMFSELIK